MTFRFTYLVQPIFKTLFGAEYNVAENIAAESQKVVSSTNIKPADTVIGIYDETLRLYIIMNKIIDNSGCSPTFEVNNICYTVIVEDQSSISVTEKLTYTALGNITFHI